MTDKNEHAENQVEDEVLKKIVPRINELAKKAKGEGLTKDEETERAELRKQYLARFRENFRSHVEMMKIYDDDGNEITSDKVKEVQRDKGLRDD